MRMLDLFCGAGAAVDGYRRAFGPALEIVGVDHLPQPHYPGTFIRTDVLRLIEETPGEDFDFYHASPPCQCWSSLTNIWKRRYPDYIAPTRAFLQSTGKPYVIENVPGAPLHNPVTLCGTMFHLLVIRHRLFETHPPITEPPGPCNHQRPVIKSGRRPDPRRHYHSIHGHFSDVAFGRQAMGIDRVLTQHELSQAIPPAYTEWIGRQMLAFLPTDFHLLTSGKGDS